MGTSVGVGHSTNRNPVEAGKEAALKALEKAGITVPDFVMVFDTVGYNQQLLIDGIRRATSGAPLSGCSGEGIITRETVTEGSFGVCVMVIRSDELSFFNACVKGIGELTDLGGARLAEQIRGVVTEETHATFVLADGLVFNFDPFIAAFEGTLGAAALKLPVFGGLAADNWASQKTFQYHNDEVFSQGISCVVMSGRGELAWGVNHGCIPVGTKRTVTRCKGNVIYEIDGVPVLEVLQEYLEPDWMSEWNKASLNLCLGFETPDRIKGNYEEYMIRYMMGKNDQEGYVTIQSEVTDGTDLWIVRRDKELITQGVEGISRQIKEGLAGRIPKFILQFECVGRGKVVFRESEKVALIRTLQREIGPDIPWMGFYTYGEIGPIVNYNSFHNFTSVVTAVF